MISRDEIGILIVEPSDTYQRILVTLLKRIGFTNLSIAANPMKAMVLLQHNKSINVVLAELMLPEPHMGVSFVKSVREKYDNKALPVIMMTNLSEKNYVQEAISAGISGYLIKPIDPDHLESHLWRLFDLPLRGSQKMGEFLVNHGLISSEQRDLALKFQKEFAVPVTVLALNLGFVTVAHLKDWALYEDDEGFFDHSKEMGLADEQVHYLQELKSKQPLRLGDILVQFGYTSKEKMEAALCQFRSGSSLRGAAQNRDKPT